MQAQPVGHKLLRDTGSIMHKVRRMAVEAVVMSTLSGTRLTVTDLGRSIERQAKQKHGIQRADRRLSNPPCHAQRKTIYTE